MKSALGIALVAIMTVACGHKQTTKNDYKPAVSFEQEGKKFEADIQLPEDLKSKAPLVVIVHEWWGRTPYIMDRARMLNKEGFASVAVDLYGDNKTVGTPSEAQALATPFYKNPEMAIERINKYIELAKKDPHVDPNEVYVIGYCFGGTQALNYARSGANVEGVVSFHGGLTSTITPKDMKAKILVLNGAADPMVPPEDVKAFEKEMKKAKADYKIIHYPGALHAFTNPLATERGKKFNIPIAYDKSADEASWKALIKFLKK